MSDSMPPSEPTPDPIPEPTPEPTPTPAPSSQPISEPVHQTGSTAKSAFDPNDAVAALKAANPLDLAMIGLGLLAFIGSLLPWYTVSVKFMGSSSSGSANAWNGFFGWFAVLCAVAAAAILVVKLLDIALPIPTRTAVLGLFGLGLVCTVLALFITPGGKYDKGVFGSDMVDQGHGFGLWLVLLIMIGGTALAAMRRTAD